MWSRQWVQERWYGKQGIFAILKPLSWVFAGIVKLRRWAYRRGWFASFKLDVPVVVVGNITAGGTGKTPVVIWLAQQLKLRGYRPGIVSRGYGAESARIRPVMHKSDPKLVGDEPLLIEQRTGCPMMVGADRVAVGQAMRRMYPMCDVLICDDGLQHYRLQRDVELVVVDMSRGMGNRDMLPAGPLRESVVRLQGVDAVVLNGQGNSVPVGITPCFGMRVVGETCYNLVDHQKIVMPDFFAGKSVKAIAGIGNPARFFAQLKQLGIAFEPVIFEDHHAYSAQELAKLKADVVIMTEKDAVKCQGFAQDNCWVLPVDADISSDLTDLIVQKISKRQM